MLQLAALRAVPWKLVGVGIMALTIVILFAALQMEKRHSDKLEVRLEKAVEGRKADRKAYRDAQEKAAELNKQEIERIEQQSEAINEERVADLNSRLERLRRELRAKAAGDASGGPEAGPIPEGPERTAGGAGVCLTPAQLLRGAENEERHHQLIQWVKDQSEVKR